MAKKEKTECTCYSNEKSNAVELRELLADATGEVSVPKHTTIFVVNGSIDIEIYDNSMKNRLVAGDFVFMPANIIMHYRAAENSVLLIAKIVNSIKECHLYNLEIVELPQKEPRKIEVLTSNKHMKLFTQSLVEAIGAGMRCELYMHVKANEFVHLLFSTYSKEDRNRFYSLIASEDIHFSEYVWNNYRKHRSIKSLAKGLHMTPWTFQRHFKRIFGINPIDWIYATMEKEIYKDLCDKNNTIKEILDKYSFSQHSNFTRYCQKTYKLSPAAIRQSLKLEKAP